MKSPARVRVGIWLGFVLACAIIVARSQYGADLAAFLPGSPSPTQRFLVDELREGVVSRVILIGIEAREQDKLAAVSRSLAARLEKNEQFAYVANGAQDRLRADGEFLLRNRYVLSPAVTVERFGAAGIRRGLEQQLDLLSSPTSMLIGNLLPRDPTGEMLQLIDLFQGQGGPDTRDGLWFSADGSRALLVVQTRAAGFDIDAQEQALAQIRAAFQAAVSEQHAQGTRLVVTGPGVFAMRKPRRRQARRDAFFHTWNAAGQRDPVVRLSLPARAGVDAGAGRKRCTGRYRRGKPRIRVRAWCHAWIRRHADRRGGGLCNLPVHQYRAGQYAEDDFAAHLADVAAGHG